MGMVKQSWEAYRVRLPGGVQLNSIPAGSTDFCDDKKAARKQLKACRKQIDELAGVLAAEQQRSLLIVIEGVDASGKDGTVRKVFTGVNPQYCRVVSFKEPDHEEREHDYLWRVYRALPAKGELGVFNRSHYEDVVVPSARGDLASKHARARLRQISDVERMWTENAITILKFFLHISRSEQTARFKARLENPEKHWKLKQSDFTDRKLWPKFISAYEEAIARTSTDRAPWYVVPADHKWYRDLAIAQVVVSTLQAMRPRVPKPRLDLDIFKL